MSKRPEIPAKIKRELRQEAYFGCVKCGCPIIDYHHIEPWSEVKKHEKENLVVLCPNCHREANVGAYPKEKVIEDKYNPINKVTNVVRQRIMLSKHGDVITYLGGNEIRNAQSILTAYNIRLIYFNIGPRGEALLNAIFFDEKGRLIAFIRDNEWKALVHTDLWDIQYSPGHLKINLRRNRIFLDLKAKGKTLTINGCLYAFGNKIEARNEGLRINDNIYLENIYFDDCQNIISLA